MRNVFCFLILAGPLQADPVQDVVDAARSAFNGMPVVQRVDEITEHCGADETVNTQVAYCTNRNRIFLTRDAALLPQAPYLVAHAFGHAVQVRHGVADFALSQIRARRSEEVMLRGLVERQVDCIAGFLVARAQVSAASLQDWFSEEPFAGIHWGRNPLHIGPQVSIGLGPRAEWFAIGQNGDIAACRPGEFSSDLLVAALND